MAKKREYAIARTEESPDEESNSRPRQNVLSTFAVQKHKDTMQRQVAKNNFLNIVQGPIAYQDDSQNSHYANNNGDEEMSG